MLTPTERFIFSLSATTVVAALTPDSFLFLFSSMIMIAAALYLPHHVAFLAHRAYFYYSGDRAAFTATAAAATAAAAAAAATAATSLKMAQSVAVAVEGAAAAVMAEL
jgi:hypothetical protein